MARPGVYVEEVQLPRLLPQPSSTETYGAFIGTAIKGPTHPTLVRSWGEFVTKFGGFGSSFDKTSLAYSIWQFTQNSGKACYVTRVLGGGASRSTGIFNDDIGGTPTKRFDISAVNPGVWGDTIRVTIETTVLGSGGTDVQRFELVVWEMVRGTYTVSERFTDLSMDPDDPRYVEKIVNSNTIGSYLIRVTDSLRDGTNLNLDLQGEADLVGGDDGDEVYDYDAAFEKYEDIASMLIVNMCGHTDSLASVAAKVKARGNSLLVADTPEGSTTDAAVSSSPAIDSEGGDYTALYYPWIWIKDPVPGAAPGSVMLVPPGASAAGMILREHNVSRAKAPAGVTALISGAVATETRMTSSDLDKLAASNVNVIRPVAGAGIVSMGARTRSTTTARYLSVRRTLNLVKQRAKDASMFALFEPNTPALWDQLRVANAAWLNRLWGSGGLAGSTPSEAFYVKADSDINTPQTIAAGEVHMEIGVAPVFPSEFIRIRVGQFEPGGILNSEEV